MNNEWDPLPGTPEDEYDEFATKIASMLISGVANAQSIAEYLREVDISVLEVGEQNIEQSQYLIVSNRILSAARRVQIRSV